jgi:hypothetical protein
VPPNFTQVDGPDKTGDIYKQENIRAFDAVIARNTQGEGVDLVVADGVSVSAYSILLQTD